MIFEFAPIIFSEVALYVVGALMLLAIITIGLALWIKGDGNRLLAKCRSKKTRKAVDIRDLDGDN